jgi:hypothetical protein
MKNLLGVFVLWTLLGNESIAQVRLSFQQLPVQLKNQSTLIVLGKYKRFRGPCYPMRMKEGKMGRRWSMYFGFSVKRIAKGNMKLPLIRLSKYDLPTNQANVFRDFKTYQYYWLLLRPSEQTQKLLDKNYIVLRHRVSAKEVVAIYPAEEVK